MENTYSGFFFSVWLPLFSSLFGLKIPNATIRNTAQDVGSIEIVAAAGFSGAAVAASAVAVADLAAAGTPIRVVLVILAAVILAAVVLVVIGRF